jgi:hypothetical protein
VLEDVLFLTGETDKGILAEINELILRRISLDY